MSTNKKLVAVKCAIEGGMFSSERMFTVELANGETHRGVASVDFFWLESGEKMVVAASKGTTVSDGARGYVAGRVLEELDNGEFAIEVPDGEVLALKKANIVPRPSEVRPNGFSVTNVA